MASALSVFELVGSLLGKNLEGENLVGGTDLGGKKIKMRKIWQILQELRMLVPLVVRSRTFLWILLLQITCLVRYSRMRRTLWRMWKSISRGKHKFHGKGWAIKGHGLPCLVGNLVENHLSLQLHRNLAGRKLSVKYLF